MTGPGHGPSADAAPAGPVRPAALAGSWYPSSPAILLATARNLMRQAAAAPAPPGKPVALVVPHAGWAYSGAVAAAAFRLLPREAFARVVVVAPSHHGAFGGYALDDASAYATPLGEVPLDRAAVEGLKKAGLARIVSGVTGPEHAVEIELPFLQAALGRFSLVPVLVGRVDAADEAAFAERLAKLDDGKTLFVFSSDLTHYGPRFDYAPFGPTEQAAGKIRSLDAEALGGMIAADRASGMRPICIVGNAGTVNTGAIDDLPALAALAEREGMWFHVDGAFGALACLSPGLKPLVAGMERADSLTFDFHKWLYLPYEIGVTLVRDAEAQRRAFSLTPDYLVHGERGLAAGLWFSDYGVQLSRGFRALKAWMHLKEHGAAKLGRLIAQNVAQARHLASLVERSNELELMAPVPLNIVCFRYRATGLDEPGLEAAYSEALALYPVDVVTERLEDGNEVWVRATYQPGGGK